MSSFEWGLVIVAALAAVSFAWLIAEGVRER